jgi:hypothetical protein
MTDMTQVTAPKSDQINADDLIGGPRIVTVAGVQINAGQEQPVSITLANEPRCYRPCKSMSRVLVAIWGADANAYIGRSLKLYRDADVTWGGMKVGGIRISEMTDMRDNRPVTMALTATRKARALYTVKPLVMPKAEATQPGPDYAAICRKVANRGTDAMRAWWGSDEGKAARTVATAMLDEMKAIASKADAAIADDPFGLPPLNDTPTADQLAAAEAEAMAAAKQAEVM